MKQRTFNILLTVLFCLFIGGMFLGSILLPDRTFSQLENRNLAAAPKLSWETVTTGTFMEDAEDYVNDQIIGRDFWVALKAWSERVSGKQENNGVYFAKEDTLISRVDTPAWEDTPAQGNTPAKQGLQTRIGYVNALVNNVTYRCLSASFPLPRRSGPTASQMERPLPMRKLLSTVSTVRSRPMLLTSTPF